MPTVLFVSSIVALLLAISSPLPLLSIRDGSSTSLCLPPSSKRCHSSLCPFFHSFRAPVGSTDCFAPSFVVALSLLLLLLYFLIRFISMQVISSASSGDVKFWDLRSNRSSTQTLSVHQHPVVTAVSVHNFAPLIAVGSQDQRIKVFVPSLPSLPPSLPSFLTSSCLGCHFPRRGGGFDPLP